MKPQIHLHIGHGKVASSTIQAALKANIDSLREQGCLVADERMEFPVAGPVSANAVPYFKVMWERERAGMRDFGVRMAALEEHRGSGRFHRAVISAENLTTPGMERIVPLLQEEFDVRVHYYVRRPDDWILSAWKQWGVKEGVGVGDFCADCLDKGHPPFLRVAERWQGVTTDLRVRPLHPTALHGGDIVQDLFNAIGCTPGTTDIPRVNPSFDLALLEVMAASPFLFRDANDNRLFHHLQATLPEGFPMERAALGRDMLQRIHDRLDPDNRELHRRFFPDVDYEQVFGWREPDPAAVDPAGDPLARLRRVVGYQLDRLRDLEQRLDQLEAGRVAVDRAAAEGDGSDPGGSAR